MSFDQIRTVYTNIDADHLQREANIMNHNNFAEDNFIGGLWYGYGNASKARSNTSKSNLLSINLVNPVFYDTLILDNPFLKVLLSSKNIIVDMKLFSSHDTELFTKNLKENTNNVKLELLNLTKGDWVGYFHEIVHLLRPNVTSILRIESNEMAHKVNKVFKLDDHKGDCPFYEETGYLNNDLDWSKLSKIFDGIEFMVYLDNRKALINLVSSSSNVKAILDIVNHYTKFYYRLKNEINTSNNLQAETKERNIAIYEVTRLLQRLNVRIAEDEENLKLIKFEAIGRGEIEKLINNLKSIFVDYLPEKVPSADKVRSILDVVSKFINNFGSLLHKELGKTAEELTISKSIVWMLVGFPGMGVIWDPEKIIGVEKTTNYDIKSYLSSIKASDKVKKVIKDSQGASISNFLWRATDIGRFNFALGYKGWGAAALSAAGAAALFAPAATGAAIGAVASAGAAAATSVLPIVANPANIATAVAGGVASNTYNSILEANKKKEEEEARNSIPEPFKA